MAEWYPRQDPRAAWRVYEGEAVIVSPADSMLHTLNPVGTLIWQAADGRTSVGTIAACICDVFEVDRDRAARDVKAFVETLRERGLLTVSETPEDPPEGDGT